MGRTAARSRSRQTMWMWTIACTSTSWIAPTPVCTSSSSPAKPAKSRVSLQRSEAITPLGVGPGDPRSGAHYAQVRRLAHHEAAVDLEIILHHAAGGEALLGSLAHRFAWPPV